METISEKLEELIKPADIRLKLIWLGQFFSFAIYAFIPFQVAAKGEKLPAENALILTIIFSGLAFLIMIGSFILRHFTSSPTAIAKLLNKGSNLAMNSNIPITKEHEKQAEELSPDEQLLFKFSIKSFPVIIMSWGMLQSAGIFGMVLATLTHNPIIAIPFISISAMATLFHFPNLKSLFNAALVEKSLRQF